MIFLAHFTVYPAKADVQCAALISLARRSFSVGGCSMKITEDMQKYAAKQGLTEVEALELGTQEKAKEFAEQGAEIYAKG